ncbi:DUF4173 domain-containing protein [Candidatus Uhrbacteria bacterium]|nr:DUF4173 domain-containing protein [Candidatus Uhrbacteria bacterium]
MQIRFSYVLLLAAFALAGAFDVLFYDHAPTGINVLLADLLFLGVSLALAKTQNLRVPFAAKVAGGFALAFSATFAIWTSPWSLGFDYVGLIVANILFAVFLLGEAAHYRHPVEVLMHLVVTPVIHAIDALPFTRTLMPQGLSPKDRSIVKAVLIAIPILLVFLAIFAGADAVFRNVIDGAIDWIESWMDIETLVSHGFFLGFFVVLFGLFFAAAFWKRRTPRAVEHASLSRAVLESKIILGSVAVLFALFLIISGSTLFGFGSFADLGMTYSEYARQGFGQLSAAAALVIGLIMTLRVLHGETVDKRLTGLQAILLTEAGLVLISAFIRLGLYITAYGYTPARLFGLWFFALVGVFLLMTLGNIIMRKPQHALVTQMLIVTGVAILLFTVSAPDARSVRLNASWAQEHNEKFPLEDARHLSAEAAPALLDVTGLEFSDFEEDEGWQTWNFSRVRAKEIGKRN